LGNKLNSQGRQWYIYDNKNDRTIKVMARGKDCKVVRNLAPKCINCKGQHPANYKGCEVAVELQKMRDKLYASQLNQEVSN